MQGGGGTAEQAFTMAEILLSLTIIGVVAAITLPSLTGNINERTWNTQRKALYARFSQAISLMPALNGYGTLTQDADGNVTEDTAAETFVTGGLSKVLKVNNICDSEHLSDCGIPTSLTNFQGSKVEPIPKAMSTLYDKFVGYSYEHAVNIKYSQIDTKAAAFETANGESILVYYNPSCSTNFEINPGGGYNYMQGKMCVNFVYDLNGTKGPNTFGKDIGFMTAFYSIDPILVAPMPTRQVDTNSGAYNTAVSFCRDLDDGGRIPSMEEMAALEFNNKLFAHTNYGTCYWTNKLEKDNKAYYFNKSGYPVSILRTNTATVFTRCVKR